jgi:CBS domain-containing protein
MFNTKIKDLMACDPEFISGDVTLEEAAEKMSAIDCGVLPVGDEDNVQGIITDRDIVIRALAKGKDPAKETVQTHMTTEVYRCKEGDTLKQAAEQMQKHKVSRLIVQDNSGEATGILSFGHILRNGGNAEELSNVVQLAIGQKAA